MAFSRGVPAVLASNAAGPGALVYRVDHAGGQRLVAINSADHAVLVDAFASGLRAGSRLLPTFAIDGEAPTLTVDARGRLQLQLPARAGYAWTVAPSAPQPSAVTRAFEAAAAPTLAPVASRPDGGLALSGTSATPVQVIVDGDLSAARAVAPGPDGRWALRLRPERRLARWQSRSRS